MILSQKSSSEERLLDFLFGFENLDLGISKSV